MRCLSVYFLTFSCFSLFFSAFGQSKTLVATQFNQRLQEEKPQLLDVRTAEEFENGHIENALQANWNNREEFAERIQALDKNKPLYIYCLAGGRSAAAKDYLIKNGFTTVVELKGGINSWEAMDFPITGKKDVPQITVETFTASLPKNQVVLLDFGAEWCPPCRKMKPIIDSLEQLGYLIIQVDGGAQKELIKAYQVESLPTFIWVYNNVEIGRFNGIQDSKTLISVLKENQSLEEK